ncbi:hypothetical protein BC830DRAFT_1102071 [Chytriomyces sp. MP71]|nr:hypothetical protein BC830DRAFT_1102071 [Chytriomyces sp. MP71]
MPAFDYDYDYVSDEDERDGSDEVERLWSRLRDRSPRDTDSWWARLFRRDGRAEGTLFVREGGRERGSARGRGQATDPEQEDDASQMAPPERDDEEDLLGIVFTASQRQPPPLAFYDPVSSAPSATPTPASIFPSTSLTLGRSAVAPSPATTASLASTNGLTEAKQRLIGKMLANDHATYASDSGRVHEGVDMIGSEAGDTFG